MNWLGRLLEGRDELPILAPPHYESAPGIAFTCPECSWDEAMEGEQVKCPLRNSSGAIYSETSGIGYVCLNCGLPFVVSRTHGAYRPNRKSRDESRAEAQARETTVIARAQAAVAKPRERMPRGMEDMKARPRE